MNFDYVIFSLLTALLFVYCGVGLTFLLCPKKFENYTLFLSPFVGLAYISYFTWWGIHYVPGGINAFIYALLLIPVLFLVAAVWLKKEIFYQSIRYPRKETLWLVLLCSAIFIVLSFPEIVILNSANVLVIGNNDIINYATISKFLVSSSLVNPVSGVDANILVLIENNNFGAIVAAAVPSSTFSIQTYMLQNSIENLFFVFSLPIIYIIAIEIFRYRPTIALIVVFLVGLNYHLIYILYVGFIGQVLGCAIFYALLLVTLYPLLNCKQDKEFWDYIPLASVLLFGLVATYSPFIPLFFIPLFGFLVLTVIMKKNLKTNITSVKFLIITSIIGIIIAIQLAINRLKEVINFSQPITAGWYVPIVSPEQILGLVGNDVGWFPTAQNAANYSTPLPFFVRFLLSIIVIYILFISLKKLFQSDRSLFYFGIVFLAVIFCGYVYFSALELASPTFTGNGYKAYKLLTYSIPLIILFFLAYFRDIDLVNIRGKNWQYVLVIVLLIAGNIWSSTAMMDMVYQKSYPIKSNIIDLQKINNIQNVSSINVEESRYSDQMWIYYFLFMNKTLHLKTTTYFQKSPLIGEWTLKSNHMDILNLGNLDKKIQINNDYYLVKNDSSIDIFFLKDGWYIPEYYDPEHYEKGAFRWSGNNNTSPSLGVKVANLTTLDLDLYYYSLQQNNSFSVELDDTKITDCIDKNVCEIKQLTLTPGSHVLKFEPKLPPTSPGSADPRTLSYAFIYVNMTSNMSTSSGAA